MTTAAPIIWFSDVDTRDTLHLGREAKRLSELKQAGFPIPPGFIISSNAYFSFLKQHKLDHRIKGLLSTVNFEQPESVMQVTHHIKKMFHDAQFSEPLTKELRKFYAQLGMVSVNMHAYSLTKDSQKHISQQAHHVEEFLIKIKESWANHFTANMMAHRHEHGLNQTETGSVLIVQSIPHPEKKGKVFTLDLVNHAKDKLFITHSVDHGADRYELSKKTLTILDRELKHHSLHTPKLTVDELMQIGKLARELEAHHYFPLEITWGFEKDQIVILKIKPINTIPAVKPAKKTRMPIARGVAITPSIATGLTKIIQHTNDLHSVKKDDIVVMANVALKDLKHLKHAKGIITEASHKRSEAAALVHKLGIPTVYNVKDAMKKFKDKTLVTIHAAKGEIYKGGFR